MIVGFTGTRSGMTASQAEHLRHLLILLDPVEFHHGDCVGADRQAHDIAQSLHIPTVIHPATSPNQRAHCRGACRILEPKPPLDRNQDIVVACSKLLATPSTTAEHLRSGTWATIRYARSQKKPVYILRP